MADRNDSHAAAGRYQIGALRVRVPGDSAAQGRAFSQALGAALAGHKPARGGQFAGGRIRVQAPPGATPAQLAQLVAQRVADMTAGARSGGNDGR